MTHFQGREGSTDWQGLVRLRVVPVGMVVGAGAGRGGDGRVGLPHERHDTIGKKPEIMVLDHPSYPPLLPLPPLLM